MGLGNGRPQTPDTTTSSAADDHLLDGAYTGPVTVHGRLRRLLLWLAPAYFVVFAVWSAVPGILLALQVQHVDPTEKVANLAVVSTVGAVVAMLAQPVAGLISDRTRSRFGRRAPWMVLGTVTGGVMMLVLGTQHTFAGLLLGWVGVSICYNFAQAPLTAIMPDRVPHLARGRLSALTGLGSLAGMLGGQFLASRLDHAITLAYAILAVATAVVFALFVLANPDRPSTTTSPPPLSPRSLLATYWVNPRRHPDFFWGFTSRFLLNLAYYVVAGGYLLYVLSDYIELGTEQAAATIPLLTLVGAPGGVLATVFSGPLSDHFRRRKIFIGVAAVLFAGAMVAPLASPTVAGMMIAYGIGALGYGVFQSVDSVLMSEVLPDAQTFGKDLGIVNMAITLPQTLAPAVAGAIVLAIGYAWLFPTAIVLSLLGALAVIPIKSVR